MDETELAIANVGLHLNGVNAAVQTQIIEKQGLKTLIAFADLVGHEHTLIVKNGSTNRGTFGQIDFDLQVVFGRFPQISTQ
jgi:hypothetical protein